MVDYETLYKLQNIKIKLLEEYIVEAARIADLYGWCAEPDDIEKLNSLTIQLDDVKEYIKDQMKS